MKDKKRKAVFSKSISLTTALIYLWAQSAPADLRAMELKDDHQAELKQLLGDIATVEDLYVPARSFSLRDSASLMEDVHQKLVIYIEDPHGVTEAQKQIAIILKRLSGMARIKEPWVALEGSEPAEIDHRVLSAIPDPTIKKEVAEYFLQSGEIDGADYYAAVFNPRVRLFGADSLSLIQRNVASYRKFSKVQPQVQMMMVRLFKAVRHLKDKAYDEDALLLDGIQARYEKKLDGFGFTKILNDLWELAQRKGLNLDAYPVLQDVRRLTFTHAGQIPADRMIKELETLMAALWNVLLNYQEAKDVHQLDRIVSFYGKLFKFSLQPEEFEAYLKNPRFYASEALFQRMSNYAFLLKPDFLSPRRNEIRFFQKVSRLPLDFYRTARRREKPLAANLARLLEKNPSGKTFFIAGGFHRRRLTQKLRERNLAYLVISPKFECLEGQENYWRLLQSDRNVVQAGPISLSFLKLRDPMLDASFVRQVFDAVTQRLHRLPAHEAASLIRTYEHRLRPVRSEVRFNKETKVYQLDEKGVVRDIEAFVDGIMAAGVYGRENKELFNKEILTRGIRMLFEDQGSSPRIDPHHPFPDGEIKTIFLDPEDVKEGHFEIPEQHPEQHPIRGIAQEKRINYEINLHVYDFFQNESKDPYPGLSELLFLLGYRNYILGRFFNNEGPPHRWGKNLEWALKFTAELKKIYQDRNLGDPTTLFAQKIRELAKRFPQSEFLSHLSHDLDAHPASTPASVHVQETTDDVQVKESLDNLKSGDLLNKGQFELISPIGKGGFAEVWLARDTNQEDRQVEVAIKVIRIGGNLTEEERAKRAMRASNEAKLLYFFGNQAERSPYFPILYFSSPFQGSQPSGYLVMTYIDGVTFDHLDKPVEKDSDLKLVVEIMAEYARAVQYMHAKGVIHRDIKPANAMVGVVRDAATRKVLGIQRHSQTKRPIITLLDLGLAKSSTDTGAAEHGFPEGIQRTTSDLSRSVPGTPFYIDPRLRSQYIPADIQSDIFSYGVSFYELLTGRIPAYRNQDETLSTLQVLDRHHRGRYKSPKELNPNISPELNELVLRLISPALEGTPPEELESLKKNAILVEARAPYPEEAETGGKLILRTDADGNLLLRPSSMEQVPQELDDILKNLQPGSHPSGSTSSLKRFSRGYFGKTVSTIFNAKRVRYLKKNWKTFASITAVLFSVIVAAVVAIVSQWKAKDATPLSTEPQEKPPVVVAPRVVTKERGEWHFTKADLASSKAYILGLKEILETDMPSSGYVMVGDDVISFNPEGEATPSVVKLDVPIPINEQTEVEMRYEVFIPSKGVQGQFLLGIHKDPEPEQKAPNYYYYRFSYSPVLPDTQPGTASYLTYYPAKFQLKAGGDPKPLFDAAQLLHRDFLPRDRWVLIRWIKRPGSKRFQLYMTDVDQEGRPWERVLDSREIPSGVFVDPVFSLFMFPKKGPVANNRGENTPPQMRGFRIKWDSGKPRSELRHSQSNWKDVLLDDAKHALVMLPFGTVGTPEKLRHFFSPSGYAPVHGTKILFIASRSELQGLTADARHLLQVLGKIYEFQVIESPYSLERLLADESAIDLIRRRAAGHFGVPAQKLGRSVILTDRMSLGGARWGTSRWKSAPAVPILMEPQRMIEEPAYRMAYLLAATALSRDDPEIRSELRVSGGAFVLSTGFMDRIASEFLTLLRVARSA